MKAAFLALVLLATAHAAEIPAAQWRVRAELLVIRVPQQDGIALASRWADPEKCQTAFAEAQELIASGKATLVADAIAHAADGQGQPSTVGLQEEFRYGTSWSGLDERICFAPKNGSKLLASQASSFEIQPCGVEFYCQCNVAPDGRSMDILAFVNNVWLERMQRCEHAVLKDGTKLFVDVPIFDEANDKSAVHLRSGEAFLLGSHLLTHPAGMMELHLLTARTRSGVAPAKGKVAEDTPKNNAAWQVCIELQKFTVPELPALEIRDEAVDAAKSEATFQRLLDAVAKGEAELIVSSLLHMLSAQRVVSETVSQQRYETELSQAQGAVFGELQEDFPPNRDGSSPPFAMERRSVGHTMEAESVVSVDGRRIELTLDSKLVRMHGSDRWAGFRDAQGKQGYFSQPEFSDMHISTHIMLESGARRCIGFQKIPGSDGRIELTFLKATTTPITR